MKEYGWNVMKFQTSVVLCQVDLGRNDVSEDCSASIIRVTRIG
jgi:hypothetical protein